MEIRKKHNGVPQKKQRTGRYVRVPRRHRLPLVLSWAVVAAIFAAAVWSVAVIDRNSCAIGWNTQRTELAVSCQTDRITVTVFGQSRVIEFHPAGWAVRAAERLREGLKTAGPAASRLMRGISVHTDIVSGRLRQLAARLPDINGS